MFGHALARVQLPALPASCNYTPDGRWDRGVCGARTSPERRPCKISPRCCLVFFLVLLKKMDRLSGDAVYLCLAHIVVQTFTLEHDSALVGSSLPADC